MHESLSFLLIIKKSYKSRVTRENFIHQWVKLACTLLYMITVCITVIYFLLFFSLFYFFFISVRVYVCVRVHVWNLNTRLSAISNQITQIYVPMMKYLDPGVCHLLVTHGVLHRLLVSVAKIYYICAMPSFTIFTLLCQRDGWI